MLNYLDKEGKGFIREINPGTKVEYRATHTTLVNNVMFIVAQVLNSSLDRYIIDYEDDVFGHDFFEEVGFKSEQFAEGLDESLDYENGQLKTVDMAYNEGIDRLTIIQNHLKNLCTSILQRNKDYIKDIPVQKIYTLYNNGACLPEKYKNIEKRIYKAFEDFPKICSYIGDMIKVVCNFRIPLMKLYIDKVILESEVERFNNNYPNSCREARKKLAELPFKDFTFDVLDFLFHNLDLMAEYVLGHCYITINQLNLVDKANQQPSLSNSNPSNYADPNDNGENIFADVTDMNNLFYHQKPDKNSIADMLVNDINIALTNQQQIPSLESLEVMHKLETFFLNGIIPKDFSKEEAELYKRCLELWKEECLKFGTDGQLHLTEKFIDMVHKGHYSELAGFSFLRSDIEDFLFKSGTGIHMSEEMEKLILSDYLNCDYRRAGIDKYDKKLLEDVERGHWDLWEDNDNKEDMLRISTPLIGRNPLADIHWNSVVGIDFGTKSTIVVYQNGDANMYPMRIGSGNYKKEVRNTDYENPTVMHFIHLERFLESYKSKDGRPDTSWEDVNISHTAAEALKMTSSEEYYSYFSDLKQWCGDQNRQVRIRDKDGFERALPAFTELEDSSFNPIELYAYFLGLFINNMHRGIFLDYILSFPITYEKAVRDKILQSFRDGLWKSLPVYMQHDEKAAESFCVSQGASEPAAYAACALTEYGFNPEESEKFFYGIFDFGGGTTDFDFGLWRAPVNTKEAKRYDYVIEHFGASGDQYLGGENLLELLAFSVFKKNQSKLREADISFTKPHGCINFLGSEMLIKDSQEAKLNTRQLMEVLRGLWEHNNPEQIKNIESGAVKVQLFSNKGERLQNFELKVNKAELEQILKDRIREGIDNFFNTLKLNFERNDVAECDCVNIFLAGNSSKSPIVWELFEEQIATRTEEVNKKLGIEDTEHLYYKIFPPLGVTKEDIMAQSETTTSENKDAKKGKKTKEKKLIVLKPTGKTGVAYGLLLCRKGGKIKDVPEKKQDDEAKFRYYLGREKKGCFKVIISTSVKYGQWTEFIDASVDKFDIYYSSSPNATTNQLPIKSSSVFLKKCTIMEENEDANIYIRIVATTTIEYAVATEEMIKEEKFLEEPVRVNLG